MLLMFFLKVASLKQRFSNSIAPGGLAGDRRGVIPASAFSFSSQQIWKTIKENKDLDLPSHKVIISHHTVISLEVEEIIILTQHLAAISGYGRSCAL